MQYIEVSGLVIVLLTQIVIIAITFQSLRERVKVLEEKSVKDLDYREIILKVESKLDLLYDLYRKEHID